MRRPATIAVVQSASDAAESERTGAVLDGCVGRSVSITRRFTTTPSHKRGEDGRQFDVKHGIDDASPRPRSRIARVRSAD